MSYYRTPLLNTDKNLQAYVIGLAIGDGNLSNPNQRAVRLRITCDKKYPKLMKCIADSLKELFPENKIGIVNRKTCADVSVYSNHLESLLGWYADKGPKHIQGVTVPQWIKKNDSFKIKCLKGLIETDGSIYNDRGYKMVIFSTIIPKLAKDVYDFIVSLGFKPHLYTVNRATDKYKIKKGIKYQVRLSKNVHEFINLIKAEKT